MSPPNNPDPPKEENTEEKKEDKKGEEVVDKKETDKSSDVVKEEEQAADKDKDDKEEESEDDEEIVEESPCGRWLKRREEIKYRDVPGIDTAYLAMDSEEGVEVVWNEAQFSTAKKFKAQEDKLNNVFDALTLIDHPNIVHFHKYWIDHGPPNEKTDKKVLRLIFITEYMSSGSLKQFLRRTKKNNRKIQLQSWKRWCTQILSALSYLHETCDPPIVHGNLNCDTIFIQHNGLVKIGSIAPDIIHQNVKTYRDNLRNLHYLSPEWGVNTTGPASDVYSFGMCALETAALDIQSTAVSSDKGASSANGEGKGEKTVAAAAAASASGEKEKAKEAVAGGEDKEKGGQITDETIQRTIDMLEDDLQKDFIRKCLRKDPKERPTARELLFHRVLFEVHSLKLLAAHSLVNTPANINETMTDEAIQSHYGPDTIMATVTKAGKESEYKLSNVPVAEKLEKFMEDVKFGIYPITAFALSQPPPPKTRACSPESQLAPEKPDVPDPKDDQELRRLTQVLTSIGDTNETERFNVVIIARFEDGMNRQLTTQITLEDTPDVLVDELIEERFISKLDRAFVVGLMADTYRKFHLKYAEKLADALDSEVESASENGGEVVTVMRKRTAEEMAALTRESVFGKLHQLSKTTQEGAEDPKVALSMRDPLQVTKSFPMPEGSFFCPPASDEGSEPFKMPPVGTNAFDISHLEAKAEVAQAQHLSDYASQQQGQIYTPKGFSQDPNVPYDPYAYLQGAQKVLEGLSTQQPQQERQNYPPSVTPGGYHVTASPGVPSEDTNEERKEN